MREGHPGVGSDPAQLSSTEVALDWLESVSAEEGDPGGVLVFAVAGHPADAAVVEDGKAVEAGDVAGPGFAAEEEDW